MFVSFLIGGLQTIPDDITSADELHEDIIDVVAMNLARPRRQDTAVFTEQVQRLRSLLEANQVSPDTVL